MTDASPPNGDAPPPAPGGVPARPEASGGGLTALATRRPVAVTMIVLTVVIFGAIAFRRLPRTLMPDISYPSVTVRTEYPGAAPDDVELRVSRRLEESLSQVRGLRRISSISRAEASDVILEFVWGTPMSVATMDVREKLEQAVLPLEVPRPILLRYDPTLDPVLQVGLYATSDAEAIDFGGGSAELAALESDEAALIQLRLLAEEEIEERLRVDGLAAVQVRGGLEREIRIEVQEDRLRDYGIDLADINRRLQEENRNQASGLLYEGDQSYVVRTVNEFEGLDEIRNLIVKRADTVPVRLHQVADVSFSYREPDVITRLNGHPCVKLDFYKEADANVVDVVRGVRARLFGSADGPGRSDRKDEDAEDAEDDTAAKSNGESERRGATGRRRRAIADQLPSGVEMAIMADQSVFIESALDNVRRTAISGGVLAILVLYVFLRRLGFTAAVGLSIPISVVATFIGLFVFDVSLNMMSLGGIALGIGMLVDNSIVVLESIFRCREEGDSRMEAAVRGTREVAAAVTASTLTTLSVFFPIVFVQGIAGQVFRDQALAVVLSLTASLIVALYFIPALVARHIDLGARSSQVTVGFNRAVFRRLRDRFSIVFTRMSSPLRILVYLPVCIILALVAVVTALVELVRAVVTTILYGLVALAAVAFRLVARPVRAGTGAIFRGFDRGFEAVTSVYRALLSWCLAHPVATLLVVAATAYGSFRVFTRLGTELIPEVHQGEFTADVRLPVGTRIERTDSIVRPLEEAVLASPLAARMETLTTTVGVEPDDVDSGDRGEHSAQMLVRLKPGIDPRAAEEQAMRELRSVFSRSPEIDKVQFENPVLFTFKTPIEIEVKGYDLDRLERITDAVEASIRSVPGLEDVRSNIAPGYPEVRLRFRPDVMSHYGLTAEAIGQLVRRKLQGEVSSELTDGDRKIGMRVRLVEEDRETLEQLRGLTVIADASSPLRLEDIADIEVSEGPAEIRRIGHQRAGVVSADLEGIDLGGVTGEIERVLHQDGGLKRVRSADFAIGFGGQKEEMDAALSSLRWALLLAVFLVYVVLAVQFESLRQPIVVIAAVPLAMIGVSPALWFAGLALSIVSFIGMIVLAGIVVNNAIVLVDRVNQVRSRGKNVTDALLEAGSVRLRPILMTTATTVLGLLPLTGLLHGLPGVESIFGAGEGAEIRGPLAITVISGLVTSTFLTLVVVPVMYLLVVGRDATLTAPDAELGLDGPAPTPREGDT